MNATTVSIITFLIALVLVIGGGLAYYMSSLIKSAYELKFALNAEIEDKFRKIEDDLDKKTRWIKKELIDEIEKIKVSVQYDSARKIDDAALILGRKVSELEEGMRKQLADAAKAFEETKGAIGTLDQKLNILRREQKRVEAMAEPSRAATAEITNPEVFPIQNETSGPAVADANARPLPTETVLAQ